MRMKIAALLVVLVASSASAEDGVPDGGLFGIMAAGAWECSMHAKLIGDQTSAERLMLVGLKWANRLIARHLSGDMTEPDMANLPTGYPELLNGPSPEFIAGRLFQHTQEVSYKFSFEMDDKLEPVPSSRSKSSAEKLDISKRRFERCLKVDWNTGNYIK